MISQEGVEKALEDIETLKKENRSLKRQLKKINEQLEKLELIGFQDQIDRLGDRITKLDKDILKTRAYFAYQDIEHLRAALESWLSDVELHARQPELYQLTHEFLTVESRVARK